MPLRRPTFMSRFLRGAIASIALSAAAISPALAETDKLVIVRQYGVSYVPVLIAKNLGLIEKEAEKQGIPGLKVEWVQFGTGQAANEALISGNVDFAMGGVSPFLTLWDKTKGRQNVKAVFALNAMNNHLTTINPNVKDIRDFTEKDRIAVAAVRSAYHAVLLQMAAEQAFGPGQHERLDKLTVSLAHPDGMAALLSGTEVTAHFTSPPYSYEELADPRVHKVTDSYTILGGPTTFNLVWTTTKFRNDNPKLYKAFYDAVLEGLKIAREDPHRAAEIYLQEEPSKLSVAFIEKIIADPETIWTTQPKAIKAFSDFMQRIGSLKNKPASWQDLFFPETQAGEGS